MKLRYKVWLENDEGKTVIGEGRLRILNAVRLKGSMSKAARHLDLPFRNLWAKIRDSEKQAGFKMVETTNLGSRLTPEGEHLISLFTELTKSCSRSAKSKFRKVFLQDQCLESELEKAAHTRGEPIGTRDEHN
jgi:molybdate transport system regulatory protein